jgi:Sulfotransferase domain
MIGPAESDWTGIPLYSRTPLGLTMARVPTQPGGRIPDFCVIGAAKTATTSIFNYLDQHPEVFTASIKEPQFFSSDATYALGLDWYRGLFAGVREGQICGEGSTSYSLYPHIADVAARLRAVNPAMRLVYIVREPVARAQSHTIQILKYLRNVFRVDLLNLGLDRAMDIIEDPDSPYFCPVLPASHYIMQIERYLAHFPCEQLLVLLYEDFVADPLRTMKAIAAHIGVDPDFAFRVNERHNVTSNFLRNLKVERAGQIISRMPGPSQARRMVPQSVRKWLKGRLSDLQPDFTLEFSEQRRIALGRSFAEANRALAHFLGRSLDEWNRA